MDGAQRKSVRFLAAYSILGCTFLFGCDDLVTIDVESEKIEPITVDLSLDLGDQPVALCPELVVPLQIANATAASATLTPVELGCRLDIRIDDAMLVSRETLMSQAQVLEDVDTTALVGIDVVLEEVVVEDGTTNTSFPPGTIQEIGLGIEDQVVLRTTELGVQSTTVRGPLPRSLVDEFLVAIEKGTELRGDVELSLSFATASTVPPTVHIVVVLQPILRVDVVRAAI